MTTRRWSSKGGRTFPSREGTPPPFAYFEAIRPAAGTARFALALDDLVIRLEGLDDALSAALVERFGPYAERDGSAASPALVVAVAREDREYYIEPPVEPEFNPVWIACDGTRVRYVGYRLAGWFDVATRRGGIVLARGTYEPELRAIENYIRCAVAWLAASRGGALVHGASAIRNGRGYLFFGESGAGKSTLSAVTSRAAVVSDDLSLLLPGAGGRLELVGSPFRGTYDEGPPVLGRVPLAAGFRILKGPEAKVASPPRAIVFGQLVGNLTFVAEAFGARPDLFAAIEAAFAPVPLYHLTFRKDDSYWDAIDEAGL